MCQVCNAAVVQQAPTPARIPFLDATRGVLAVVVMLSHILLIAGIEAAQPAASLSVLIFFAMSGYVLARAYDGQPWAFLARRIVRLWPLYIVCFAAGCFLAGTTPSIGDLVMWPPSPFAHRIAFDLPAWSLYIEVWASPALLVLFFLPSWGALLVALAFGAFSIAHPAAYVGTAFAIGVALAGVAVKWPTTTWAVPLWLGRVSYSLYLSHWVVIAAVGPVAGVPVALLVAWVLERWIERPSIRWSRAAGRWVSNLPTGKALAAN